MIGEKSFSELEMGIESVGLSKFDLIKVLIAKCLGPANRSSLVPLTGRQSTFPSTHFPQVTALCFHKIKKPFNNRI